MVLRNTLLQPRLESPLYNYAELMDLINSRRQIDANIISIFADNFRQRQRARGQKEKFLLWRKVSSSYSCMLNNPDTLLRNIFYPSIKSLNFDGYADPLSAFENQTNWTILLLNHYANNKNIQYCKIESAEKLRTSDLNMELINFHKSKLEIALNHAGIKKALCSFDFKVTYADRDGGYFHNLVMHIFYDKGNQENMTAGAVSNFYPSFLNAQTLLSKNVYNDVISYESSLKPFCSRQIDFYREPLEMMKKPFKPTVRCVHLHRAFQSMSFVDRLHIHGYKLERLQDGSYSLI